MLKKLLIVNLFLVVVLISWVLPVSVLGDVQVFKPRMDVNWTGFTELESTLVGTKYWYKKNGVILVGYSEGFNNQNNYRFHQYRGFAVFDITALPANACVSKIEVLGKSITTNPEHTLLIRRLQLDPLTESAEALHDGIRSGQPYTSCSSCMSSPGVKTIDLPFSSYAHLESSQSQGWFALGFTEFHEDNQSLSGIWEGIIPPVQTTYPALRVTYTAPPSATPVPAISVDSVCVGDQFCITWNSIPGATYYEMRVGGYWTNVGNVTSKCFTAEGVGNYTNTSYVRAVNSCGAGSSSVPVSIKVITAPAQPTTPVASAGPYCLNVGYTISWNPLSGVNSYQIREDDNSWINVGDVTEWTFTPNLAGTHSYVVRGDNMCGTGSSSSSVSVVVPVALTAPAKLVVSNGPHCTRADYTISWTSVAGADAYEIQEDVGRWINVGNSVTRTFNHTSAGTHSYFVRAINACGPGTRSSSATVTIEATPVAPGQPVVSSASVCRNQDFTLQWPNVGADSYQIKRDDGVWIDANDGGLQEVLSIASAGSYMFYVRGLNGCGSGSSSPGVAVEVSETLATPAIPEATNLTPCPKEVVTVKWAKVTNATEYRLIDYLTEKEVYVGSENSWSGVHEFGAFEYRVAATDGCGWSDASEPLLIKVKEQLTAPAAPVSDQNPALIDEPYTLRWKEVPGADYYELYEDGTALLYSGPELQSSMTRRIAGEFTYSVKACDDCGCSKMGAKLLLKVDYTTTVEEIDSPRLPNSFALDQNYPNPFNPETRIGFSLKSGGHVELAVYNVLGESIRQLVFDYLSAGYKSVIWDGRDNSGRQVSSGVYLYKLTIGEFTETKKMMLVK